MIRVMRAARWLALFATACTQAEPSSFVPDEEPASPSLRLEVTPDADRAEVIVRADGPLDLFGLSYHLRWDAAAFELSELEQPPFLSASAVMLAHTGDGDLSLGGTRRAPTEGDATIEDGTEILSFVLTSRGTAEPGQIAIEDVIGRRSDASYVAIAGESGTLTLSGGAR